MVKSSEEKFRKIELNNPLLKPVVSKNKAAVEKFLLDVGFSKDSAKPDAFLFKKVEEEEHKADCTDPLTCKGNINVINTIIKAFQDINEDKPCVECAQEKSPKIEPEATVVTEEVKDSTIVT